ISNNLIITTMEADIDVTMNYKQSTNLNSSLADSNQTQCVSFLHDREANNIELNLSNFQNISIEEPINGYLTVTNNSLFEQTVSAQIQVDLTSYTGLVITHIYFFEKMLIIQPKQNRKMEFSVPSNYFRDMFTEDWNISITAFAKIPLTNERLCTQQILKPMKPILSIEKISQKDSIASNADEEQFQISIVNPLNVLFTGCDIRIDGTGLRFYDSPILCGSIEAHNTLTFMTSAIRRTNLTERKIVAVFNCDQLKNVRTHLESDQRQMPVKVRLANYLKQKNSATQSSSDETDRNQESLATMCDKQFRCVGYPRDHESEHTKEKIRM
ncbi:unnamed protein product, partial [Acanthocheilonema viteae]